MKRVEILNESNVQNSLDINDIKDAIPKYETKSQKNNLDLSDHYIGSEQI